MIAFQPILYNLSEMSTRSLQQQRQGIHRAVRLQQLQMRFEQERMLLREVQPAAVRDIMGDSLLGLQRTFQQGDQQGTILHLTQLRNIVKQYQIADFLLCQMRLSPEMQVVREGRIGMDCTAIDLFLLLLKAEDESIREHASALMQDSLYQMREIMPRKIYNKDCQQQAKRVMDQFHPQLLSDYNIRVALHSLSAMQELLLTPNCHHTLPYLLGIYPQLLQVIANLFQHPHFANVSEYSEKVVDLCLLLLYVTAELTQFSLLREIQTMKELTRQNIVRKMFMGEFSQQLFHRIRGLALCRVAMQQEQLEYLLQRTLIHQLNNRNTQYLKMLGTVLQMNSLSIPTDALHLLINHLFHPIQDTNQQELEHMRWLANIVYKNANTFKDMLRKGIDHVIQGWQQPIFSQRTAILAKLAFRRNEALFYLLLGICHCIYEALPSLTPILNRAFSFLGDYKEWKAGPCCVLNDIE